TAGVFMVARLSPLFELAPNAQAFVMFIGATTAFFAATIGLVQNDIKRIVAYSTCSQLGYMFVAMGAGAYSVGMFHLFTHAFFKALLFLGSGSVIYAMHHEQDIRNMGGLKDRIPYTYIVMVIGTLALTGFPLTAGSLLAGFPFKELFAGHGVEEFFRDSLKMNPHIIDEMHHIPESIAFLPTVMMALGFLVSWLFYIRRPYLPVELAKQHPLLYQFLLNKWYFDEL